MELLMITLAIALLSKMSPNDRTRTTCDGCKDSDDPEIIAAHDLTDHGRY